MMVTQSWVILAWAAGKQTNNCTVFLTASGTLESLYLHFFGLFRPPRESMNIVTAYKLRSFMPNLFFHSIRKWQLTPQNLFCEHTVLWDETYCTSNAAHDIWCHTPFKLSCCFCDNILILDNFSIFSRINKADSIWQKFCFEDSLVNQILFGRVHDFMFIKKQHNTYRISQERLIQSCSSLQAD